MAKKPSPSRNSKHNSIELDYLEFFVPKVSPLWSQDQDQFSLEQPSPLEIVPTETTYSSGGIFSPVPCA